MGNYSRGRTVFSGAPTPFMRQSTGKKRVCFDCPNARVFGGVASLTRRRRRSRRRRRGRGRGRGRGGPGLHEVV